MADKRPTPRKMDRRTLYTKMVVKDALLELLATLPFEEITVAAVCRQADVTRTTFYLHFNSLTSVLDEVLDDALRIAESQSADPNASMAEMLQLLDTGATVQQLREHDTLLPACQRMADQPKYRALFMDETLSNYIIKKMYLAEREKMIPILMGNCGLSKREADKLFLLVIYGAFYVNKSMNWKKDDEWYRVQRVLSKFILGGFNTLKIDG